MKPVRRGVPQRRASVSALRRELNEVKEQLSLLRMRDQIDEALRRIARLEARNP